MLNAFEVAAGFSASTLEIMFRVIYGALITFWAAWVMTKQFYLFSGDKLTLGEYGSNMSKLMILWTSLMLVIVV